MDIKVDYLYSVEFKMQKPSSEKLPTGLLGHSKYSASICPEEEEGQGDTLGDLSPEWVPGVPGS